MALTKRDKAIYEWLVAGLVNQFGFLPENIAMESQGAPRPENVDYVTFSVLDDSMEGSSNLKKSETVHPDLGPGVLLDYYGPAQILVAVNVFSKQGREVHKYLGNSDSIYVTRSSLKKSNMGLVSADAATRATGFDETTDYPKFVSTYTFTCWDEYSEILEEVQTITITGSIDTTVGEEQIVIESTKPV